VHVQQSVGAEAKLFEGLWFGGGVVATRVVAHQLELLALCHLLHPLVGLIHSVSLA
jgi:hypothetical protein